MSDLLPSVDHIETGLARVISQYRNCARLQILTACYHEQVQHIEDAIHDVVEVWKLDNAVGWRLDVLGSLVGQARVGQTDSVYRVWVKARIAANRSDGKYGTLTKIASMVIPGWRYEELSQNVFFEVESPDLNSDIAYAVHSMLQFAAPAGVRVHLLWQRDIAYNPFLFAATGETEVDAAYGFCNTSQILPANNGQLGAGY